MLFSTIANCQVINIPFSTDFESGNAGFTDSLVSGSSWQLGSPTWGLTNSTHSGAQAWDIELNAPYANSTVSYLITPNFNLNGNNNAVLSFWYHVNSESGWDGTRIEYSPDGVTWTLLGGLQDPNATNWYTSGGLISSGLPGWDGTSSGWTLATYKLSVLGITGNIKFRYVFTSDPVVPSDGFSLDDFSIFLLPSYDAGVSNVPDFSFLKAGTPVSSFNITVTNFGSQPFNSFAVSYKINNGIPVTVPSTFNLLPGNSVNINVPGFTIPAASYHFCAYTSLPADTSHFNDTLCLAAIGWSTDTLPYFNNFDSLPADWLSVADPSGTAWELGTPNYGLTSTAHSGSSCWDVNLNTAYLAGSKTYLYSPVFNFTGVYNSVLSFFRNQNTTSYAGASLNYSTNAGATWSPLGSYLDPSGQNWYNGFLVGTNYQPGWTGNSGGWIPCIFPLGILDNTDSVMFCFVFAADSLNGDGFSIDDLNITVPSSVDAGTTYIQVNSLYAAGTVTPGVDVVVLNYASQPLDSVTVSYTINGGTQVTGTFFVGLASGLGAFVSLPGYTVPAGSYSLCAFTSMVGDGNYFNDTTCISLTGLPVLNLPFTDHFDAGNLGWATRSDMNPADQWQLGTPTTGIPNAPFSAPSCWDINLNSTYAGPSLCYLYSPVFNFTNAVKPVLSFKQNCNTESFWDGVRMEYSINSGPWLLLGGYLDPNGSNWYNTQIVNSSNYPGWSGNSFGWISSVYDLNVLSIPNGSQVGFRYVFNADNVGVYDGMALDDFSIEILLSQDASIEMLVAPGNVVSSGVITPVQVMLKNKGITAITSLDISYNANGTVFGPVTWSGNLLTDSSEQVTLPSFIPVIGVNSISVYIEWPADLNHFNDTLLASLVGLLSVSIPYFNDFENGSLGWDVYASAFANTSWELGQPSYNTTNSSFSGDSCWDVNLDTACGNLANTMLYTPIFNFASGNNSRLSCAINYNSEPFADGFWLEYTTNGITWQTLGSLNDPSGINWYNSTLSNGQPAWSLTSAGWKQANINTFFLDGQPYVRMRYIFSSDFAIASVGASVDDFSIGNFTGTGDFLRSSCVLYPNPASGQFTIAFGGAAYAIQKIELIDMLGIKVFSKKYEGLFQNSYQLNVSGLPAGVYVVYIYSKDQTATRILIQK